MDKCTYVTSGYNSFTHEFKVEATTPIQLFKITDSSGKTSKPKIDGNSATFTMDIPDTYNFHVEYTLVDQCQTWKSGMRTLPFSEHHTQKKK